MELSRRGFLEVGALSTTGIVLKKVLFPSSGYGEEPHASASPQSGVPIARHILSLNRGWQFFRSNRGSSTLLNPDEPGQFASAPDSAWDLVNLPHSVRLEPRDASGGQNYQGICWYRRRFEARPEWSGQILYLTFHGAMQVADVWLNHVHLTTHFCGYLPFTIDLSQHVRFGKENILIVRLDNSDNPEVPPGKPQDKLDFTYFGGLYRGVELEIMDPLHISDAFLANKIAGGEIFVTYPHVSKTESIVQVQTDIVNETLEQRECLVSQQLMEEDGRIAASESQTIRISAGADRQNVLTLRVRNPRLWHPNHPNLYWLHTTISDKDKIVDDQFTRIGIRSIRFDNESGLTINGEPFFSLGANRHQDHPYVGYALPGSAHYRDAVKLRDAGFTSYRSHYPQDSGFMDACDELGILAVVSNPGWQFVGGDTFKKRVYQDAREMIRRDRNRPSVILWEAALNESNNESLAAELYRIVHEEYPGHDCYASGDHLKQPVNGFDGWDIEYGAFGGRDAGYSQANSSRPWWIREWGDEVDNWSDQQGPVRVARGWGETPMLTQASAHLRSLESIYSHTNKPAGADLWAGIDAYRGYHHQPFLGGPLDLFRLPKFDYFLFQSQRPVTKEAVAVGSGPMVFIANFASFYSPSAVTVFSNCERVRLFKNGKEIATQKPDTGYHIPHPPFTFSAGEFSQTRTMLFSNGVAPSGTEIGELRAEGLIGGMVVATHTIHSPGVPRSIRLEVDACGRDLIADGADWIRVYARICDARGVTYPFADDLVTFSVNGSGSLVGGAEIYANPVRAEAGIATALVKASTTAGRIVVRAAAPGLIDGVLEFDSRPSALLYLD